MAGGRNRDLDKLVEAPMTGQVYIANISSSVAKYFVNGALIDMPARKMNPITSTPYFVLVGRSLYPDPPGSFAFGDNPFCASFADYIPPEAGEMNCTITISPDISINDDLILYVFRNMAVLLTTRGGVVSTFTS